MSAVDHPDHYGGADNQYEAIKVIEAWGCNFNAGNAYKYLARMGKKTRKDGTDNSLEDAQKALWYLKRQWLALENNILQQSSYSYLGINSNYHFDKVIYNVFSIGNLYSAIDSCYAFLSKEVVQNGIACLESYIEGLKNDNIS